jgi:hypothetical protein
MLVPLPMTPLPNLTIALLLGLGLSLAGCCRSTEAPAPEEVPAEAAVAVDEASEAAAGETTATTAPASEDDDPMGDRAKLRDLQEQWEAKNYAYIVPPAQALMGRPDLDPALRLQVCFLLAQAYSGAGDAAKAAETMERYAKLREQILQSEAMRAQKAVRTSAQGIVSRLLEQHRQPGSEKRQSEVLEARLKGVEPGTIIELEADSGGKIFCCSDAQALEAKLAGVRQGGEELVVQHDTEFDFYYAIQEEPPPVGVR